MVGRKKIPAIFLNRIPVITNLLLATYIEIAKFVHIFATKILSTSVSDPEPDSGVFWIRIHGFKRF